MPHAVTLRGNALVEASPRARAEAETLLARLLARERSRAERLLNGLRLAVLALLGTGAVVYAPTLPPALREANVAVLVPMLAWTLFQAALVYRRDGAYPSWLSAISSLVDTTALTAIILCYGLAGTPAVALKAPIVLVYFAILAARPLTGSAREAALTASVMVVEYVGVVVWLLLWGPVHPHFSTDPIAAASSADISILDEVMKITLLAFSGAVATYATAWHERVLRRALTDQIARSVEERQLTQRLQEADKLAALGTLAASIAHEVANPLAAIALSAEMLGRSLTDDEARAEATAIAADARRTVTVMRDLLAVARTGDGERAPVVLRNVIDRALGTLRSLLRDRGVTVKHDGPSDLPAVTVDAGAFERVIINLVINAAQAMEAQSTPRRVRITTAFDEAELRLVVEDTGPGFSPEVAERLFERFFTTKPAGEGTGLGLWMVGQVVADHGGQISAADTGHGARFTITLPRTAREEVEARVPVATGVV